MRIRLLIISLFLYLPVQLTAQWNWSKGKLYTTNDGLFEREITGVAVDQKNMVWMSTPSGIYLFDGHSFFPAQTVYPELEKYIINTLSSIIYIKQRNEIWFSTSTAVYCIPLDDLAKHKNSVRKIAEFSVISGLLYADMGMVFFTNVHQLYHINSNDSTYKVIKDQDFDHVINFFKGPNHELYIIQAKNEVFNDVIQVTRRNSSDTARLLTSAAGLISKEFTDSFASHGREFYKKDQYSGTFSSYKTVFRDSLRAYHIISEEMNNSTWILGYFEDRGKNLWIATVSGLIRIPATPILFGSSQQKFETRSVFYNPQYKRLIYCGPQNYGIYSEIRSGDPNIKSKLEVPRYFNASVLWNDSTWIAFGENNPVIYFAYNPVTDNSYTYTNTGLKILFSCQKINGQLWSGSLDEIEISNRVNKTFVPEKSIPMPPGRTLQIAKPAGGNTVVATTNGLYLINISTLEKKLLLPGFFYCVTAISNERWAAGSSSGGFYIINTSGEILKQVSVKDGMPHITVYNIAFDSTSETLFCGTKQGLVSYSTRSGLLNIYTTDDGITHNEFNSNSVYISTDRILFEGGLRGINYVPVDSLKTADLPLIISKFLIRGVKNNFSYSSWNIPRSLTLENDLYHISITFTNTGASNHSYYRYRLTGGKQNSNWQYKTIQEPLEFIGLGSGDYTLEFTNENTGQENTQVMIHFTIKGPWYTNNWLIIAGCLLVLAALRFLVNWRERQRYKKVTFEKLMSENELKAIRAQINPQFIQHTFDHITGLIQNDSKDHAVRSLREISVYMRQVLNMTEETLITLEEELDYTELYLHTQSLINPGLFSYNIDLADDVDTIGIHLPAMLLQPVTEHCIKYGFAERKTGGIINIKVTQHDHDITITVMDNGSSLNAQGKPLHRNIQEVVSLTKKRLALSVGEHARLKATVETKENKTPEGSLLYFIIRFTVHA